MCFTRRVSYTDEERENVIELIGELDNLQMSVMQNGISLSKIVAESNCNYSACRKQINNLRTSLENARSFISVDYHWYKHPKNEYIVQLKSTFMIYADKYQEYLSRLVELNDYEQNETIKAIETKEYSFSYVKSLLKKYIHARSLLQKVYRIPKEKRLVDSDGSLL